MPENAFKLDLSKLPQENMSFHEVIVNANGSLPPVLMMIQDHSPEIISHALRLYKLKEESGEFSIDYEIQAFAFPTHEVAASFANRLVNMNAIDILSLIAENSQPATTHTFH